MRKSGDVNNLYTIRDRGIYNVFISINNGIPRNALFGISITDIDARTSGIYK